MPGQSTTINISKEIEIYENIFPKDTPLQVFSHGNQAKIHYKDKNNETQRALIPLDYDLVCKILTKRRTNLIPIRKE